MRGFFIGFSRMGYQVEKMSSEDVGWVFAVADCARWNCNLLPRQLMEQIWKGRSFTVDRAAGSFMLSLPRRREMVAEHYLFHSHEWTLHLWYEDYCEFSVEGLPAGFEDSLEQARMLVEQAFKAGGCSLNGVRENVFEVPTVIFVPSRGDKY